MSSACLACATRIGKQPEQTYVPTCCKCRRACAKRPPSHLASLLRVASKQPPLRSSTNNFAPYASPSLSLPTPQVSLRARCKQCLPGGVKTRRALSRRCRYARVYGHMTTDRCMTSSAPPLLPSPSLSELPPSPTIASDKALSLLPPSLCRNHHQHQHRCRN